ncbi:glutamate synthase [Stylonychia lemnae]|uniref:Glutamate synthase n=1 Tax=Stylonychia lemnae TaxID=5949 RepID=A0A077ZUX6_STYLE|nr:glutamate synthase [Stylonychia lemnae]|eukprot:CDW73374.1 glutamate synthase [Stylonychia lemnae]
MGCQNSKEPKQTSSSTDASKKKLPHCAQKFPYKVNLEEGKTYYWCSCGLSKNQPFCDGSHKGTDYVPKAFQYDKPTGESYLCGCKHNKKESGPYCDGTHKNLEW